MSENTTVLHIRVPTWVAKWLREESNRTDRSMNYCAKRVLKEAALGGEKKISERDVAGGAQGVSQAAPSEVVRRVVDANPANGDTLYLKYLPCTDGTQEHQWAWNEVRGCEQCNHCGETKEVEL